MALAVSGCAVSQQAFDAKRYSIGDTRLCRTYDKAAKSGDVSFRESVQSELDRRGISDGQCQALESRQNGAIAAGVLLSAVAAVAVVAARHGGGSGGGAYDTEWDWDEFYNASGQLVWECRGVQTGQFAPAQNCAGLPMTDWRWPGK